MGAQIAAGARRLEPRPQLRHPGADAVGHPALGQHPWGVQVLAHWLCRACLTAVGRLYRSGPPHVHARIWKESRVDRLIRDELDALGREASLPSGEQTFAAFKKDLAGIVGPEDGETHCDLPIPYG